jgi:hypothetical protein
MMPLELKEDHKEGVMATETHDAIAGGDFLAARIVNAPIPLLLVASKQWREIRKRIEEDAHMGVAEDLLTRAEEAGVLDPIG